MKRYFILIILALFSYSASSSQIVPGLNYCKVIGHGKGKNITFTDPLSGQAVTKFVGELIGHVNPNYFPLNGSRFYSLNLYEDPVLQDTTYIDTEINMDRTITNIFVLYDVLLNFPDDSSTAASLQAMIWRQTNGLNVGTITDSTVKARSLYVISVLNQGNWTNCFPEQALKLQSIGIDQIRVEVYHPLCTVFGPAPKIHLSISGGELSDTIIDIDENGNSPLVTVSGASNGSIITATAPMLPPGPNSLGGRLIATSEIFRSANGGPIILRDFAKGFPSHRIDWGTLPVELSAFTSIVNINNVTLNWTTASELNNSEFRVERKFNSNWEAIAYIEGQGTTSTPKTYQYTDRDLQPGIYSYRLMQIDYNGNFEYFNLNNEVVIGIPKKFELKQNYPNPFNPSTTINYTLPVNSRVSFSVYDISGKEIQNSVQDQLAGYYSITFDGSNFSSGIYYYRITSGNFSETKKMMLIK